MAGQEDEISTTKSFGGSGTFHGYHVEVRLKPDALEDAHQAGEKFIVTKNWKRIPVDAMPFWGTRNELWEWDFYPHAKELRLMRWETANAIAAQVAAQHHLHSFLMEFRFVQVEVKHTYSHREVEVSSPFNFGAAHKGYEWEKFTEAGLPIPKELQ